MLTLKQLKAMPPCTVFATGVVNTNTLNINDKDIRWIAERGKIHDWAIYYHLAELPISRILEIGTKLFYERTIRELVPCSNKAFDMYRY